eukprot:1154238-Pelagomonas_calceolata.AAC.7
MKGGPEVEPWAHFSCEHRGESKHPDEQQKPSSCSRQEWSCCLTGNQDPAADRTDKTGRTTQHQNLVSRAGERGVQEKESKGAIGHTLKAQFGQEEGV